MNDGTVTAPDGSGRQVKLITADDVVAYLKAHPDFFDKNPELSAELAPRVQGPGVIDMQQTILKRLRVEIDRLKNERTEIIANSKQNQIVQNRIQAAVISIIQASTFEKMIHVVTHELPELLDVDFITLAIEANADAPKRSVILKEQWNKIGVELKIEQVEFGVAVKRLGDGDFDVFPTGRGMQAHIMPLQERG